MLIFITFLFFYEAVESAAKFDFSIFWSRRKSEKIQGIHSISYCIVRKIVSWGRRVPEVHCKLIIDKKLYFYNL